MDNNQDNVAGLAGMCDLDWMFDGLSNSYPGGLSDQRGFAQTRLYVAPGHPCGVPGRIHSSRQQGQPSSLWRKKQTHTSSN